jgi:hypothetical protein
VGVREEIQAGLTGVPGIKGFTRKPSAPKAGDAWPRRTGGERTSPGSFETTWQVIVKLPNSDEAARDEWLDDHLWPIIDALAGVVFVESWENGVIDDAPALMLNSRE